METYDIGKIFKTFDDPLEAYSHYLSVLEALCTQAFPRNAYPVFAFLCKFVGFKVSVEVPLYQERLQGGTVNVLNVIALVLTLLVDLGPIIYCSPTTLQYQPQGTDVRLVSYQPYPDVPEKLIQDLQRYESVRSDLDRTDTSYNDVGGPPKYELKQVVKQLEKFTGAFPDEKGRRISTEFDYFKRDIFQNQRLNSSDKIDSLRPVFNFIDPYVRSSLESQSNPVCQIAGYPYRTLMWSYNNKIQSGVNVYAALQFMKNFNVSVTSIQEFILDKPVTAAVGTVALGGTLADRYAIPKFIGNVIVGYWYQFFVFILTVLQGQLFTQNPAIVPVRPQIALPPAQAPPAQAPPQAQIALPRPQVNAAINRIITEWLQKLNGDKLVYGYTQRVQFLRNKMNYNDPDLPYLAQIAFKYNEIIENKGNYSPSAVRHSKDGRKRQLQPFLSFEEDKVYDGKNYFQTAVDILKLIHLKIKDLK